MMKTLQLLSAIVMACVLSNCSCLVSSKLGDRLDSVGYAEAHELEYAESKPFYELNGCYYARVRIAYHTPKVPLMSIAYVSSYSPDWQATGEYVDGYMLMSAKDVSHMLEKKVNDPPSDARPFIPVDEFATLGAQRLHHKGCANGCKIGGVKPDCKYLPDLITLTCTGCPSYQGVPVKRSIGNYALKPLSMLVSYGVDAPISLVGSAVYCLVVVPSVVVYCYFN